MLLYFENTLPFVRQTTIFSFNSFVISWAAGLRQQRADIQLLGASDTLRLGDSSLSGGCGLLLVPTWPLLVRGAPGGPSRSPPLGKCRRAGAWHRYTLRNDPLCLLQRLVSEQLEGKFKEEGGRRLPVSLPYTKHKPLPAHRTVADPSPWLKCFTPSSFTPLTLPCCGKTQDFNSDGGQNAGFTNKQTTPPDQENLTGGVGEAGEGKAAPAPSQPAPHLGTAAPRGRSGGGGEG